MKKKIEVVIKCTDKDQVNKYLTPDYPKLVIANVYDKFWGPCEVADLFIKRFQEAPENANKTDFICIESELAGEIFAKTKFGSKPKYFLICVRSYVNV